MAIQIEFDYNNIPQNPTLVLAKRYGEKLGIITARNIVLKDTLNSYSEMSFVIDKAENSHIWNDIKDFRLVWCKEFNLYFEMNVTIDETDDKIKTVTCRSLGECELSQIKIYDLEINSEKDKSKDDYIPTLFYKEYDTLNSLLHKLMAKSPNYDIVHVDNSLQLIEKSYSFDDVTIYEAMQTISEEMNCIFKIEVINDNNGEMQRQIKVYDLQSNCLSCGYRGDFTDTCRECQSNNIKSRYGNDANIFVSADNLADEIQYSCNVNNVKNAFRLVGGDDTITQAIKNCNPNGDYIWYISDELKSDMSAPLQAKLTDYETLYDYYQNDYRVTINSNIVNRFNEILTAYKPNEETYSQVQGFKNFAVWLYKSEDLKQYIQSLKYPAATTPTATTAQEQAERLISYISATEISVENILQTGENEAQTAISALCQTWIDSRYKVSLNDFSYNSNTYGATFTISVENKNNSSDSFTSNSVSKTISYRYKKFVEQHIHKELFKLNTDKIDMVSLFKSADFSDRINDYCIDALQEIEEAGNEIISVLQEKNASDIRLWAGNADNLYTQIYLPYLNKCRAVTALISTKESQIVKIDNFQKKKKKIIYRIMDILNFENYLGADLFKEFCSYKREDTYRDDSFISDGLSHSEIIYLALEFIKKAKADIFKSATMQHTITARLKNLLAMQEFQPIVNNFAVGNWIWLKVDGNAYKLRLLDYTIDFENLNNLSVTFSDVEKVYDGISDLQSILNSAANMSTSFGDISRKAEKGNKSNELLNNWVQKGLDTTTAKIVNKADKQSQIWDEHGMLFRKENPFTNSYDPEQLKIINSTIAITDDAWETTKTAIGGFYYYDTQTQTLKYGHGVNGETIIGKLLLGERMRIVNADNSLTFDGNGLNIQGQSASINISPNATNLLTINNGTENIFYVDNDGVLHLKGDGAGLDLSNNNLALTVNQHGVIITGLQNNLSQNYYTKTTLRTDDSLVFAGVEKRLQNYYTKAELNLTDDSIQTTVSNIVDNKTYSKSEIDQKDSSIRTTVQSDYNGKFSTVNQKLDSITTTVSDGNGSSTTTLTPSAVKLAWSNIAEAIKFEGSGHSAQINIYDDNDVKLMQLDKNGQGFYKSGTKIGKIGTNTWSNTDNRGLVFDLENAGNYMTWAWMATPNAPSYTTKWTYCSGANDIGTMTKDTLHAGCNLDMHSYKLQNPVLDNWNFKDGSVTGTFSGVYITQMNSDGTAAAWKNFSLTFKNGILQSAAW